MENEGLYGSLCISKGRIGTDIRNRIVPLPIDPGPGGIDSVGRKHPVFPEGKIGRRKSQHLVTPPETVDHISLHGIGAAEKAGGLFHMSGKDFFPDSGGRKRRSLSFRQLYDIHRHPGIFEIGKKAFAVSQRSLAKGEVLSHHQAQKAVKGSQFLHESFRAF